VNGRFLASCSSVSEAATRIRSFLRAERIVIDLLSASQTRGFGGRQMTLKLRRIGERHGTRICLAGELRSSHLINVRAEIKRSGNPAILDLDEVDVIDIDGVRFLNECRERGIEVVNCSRYIREWMLQEKRICGGDK
jgi:hypothetical protein